MAGNIKSPVRKQWKIPDTTLYKLRYQLAEDGCMESQVEIAKQLLQEECDIRAIREANYRQAIHWLLRSAEQGSEEALKLLETCHHRGCGVTDENINDIKTCLNMTQYEKIARKTAREIYSCLSKECDHIRLRELNEHMLKINFPKKSTEDQFNQKCMCNEFEKVQDILIKESNLLSAAISFANGSVPSISQFLSLNSCSCFRKSKSNLLPYISFKTSNSAILKLAKAFLAIFSNIYFHLSIFLYLCLNSSHLSLVIPLTLYYMSFVFMTIITFRIFDVHKTYQHFSMWANLFHYHSDGALDSENVQFEFLEKNTKHQKEFFLMFILHLALHPLVHKYWILHTEFALLSLYLSAVSIIVYGSCNSQNSCTRALSLCSCVLNLLARYPYENNSFMNKNWTKFNFDISNSPPYILGSKIEFNLNCKAFLYAAVPGVLVILSKMKNWHGVYLYLLPHCITLGWFQLFILNVEFITINGLLRNIIIILILIFFWPLYESMSIILPILAFDSWLNIQDIKVRISLILGLITSAAFTRIFLEPYRTKNSIIFKFKVPFILFSILFLTSKYTNPPIYKYDTNLEIENVYINDINNYDEHFLTWDEYQNICLNPTWKKANHIISQIDCFHLNGLKIKWDGYITNIRLSKIQNIWSDLFNTFPDFISEKLKCLIGQETILSCTSDDCQRINKKINWHQKCNVDMWNRYEHEITVNLQTGILTAGPKIILKGGHEYSNITQALQINDKISFKGILEINNLKNSLNEHLVINLVEITCLNCYRLKDNDVTLTKSIESSKNYYKYLIISFRNILNFILNPVIVLL